MNRVQRLAVTVADWAHVARRYPASLLDRTPADALTSGEGVPLVLLPGIYETWRYLLPLARALHALGHPIIPVPGLGLNRRPLAESATLVARLLSEQGVENAVMVAHSKGGLIGKAVLLEPAAAGRVHGLVALCSPFGGSSLAWRVWERTPLGMFAPRGSIILGLAAEQAVNERIVSLASRWDEVIPEGAHLEGAVNEELPVAGHFLPLVHEATAGRVHAHVEALAGRR